MLRSTLAVFCLGLLAVLSVAPAGAQQIRVEREPSGLFREMRPGQSPTRPREGMPLELAKATLQVPARLGTMFGVQFKIEGVPAGQTVTLRAVWRPPVPLHDPKTGREYPRIDDEFVVKPGVGTVRAYSLDNEWELVPGKWTVDILHGERRLFGETFTVLAR